MAAFFSPFFEATLPGMVATNPLDLLQTKVGIISLNVNDTGTLQLRAFLLKTAGRITWRVTDQN